jgi:hypothetical protein
MPTPISFDELVRRKLPFWQTLRHAYVLTLGNLGGLVRLSWKWMLLLLPFQVLFYWHALPHLSEVYAKLGSPDLQPMPFWVTAGAMLLGLVSYVIFSAPAVGWHRLILRQITPSGIMEVDRPTLRYAGYVLLLYGLYNLPGLLQQALLPAPGEIPSGAQLLAMITISLITVVGLVIFFRFTVFLPGVAIDDPRATLNDVWRTTRGHTFRLLFGNLLAALPFALVSMAATYYLVMYASHLTATLLVPVATWLVYIGIAVGLTFTSLAYRFFYLEEGGARPD